MECGSLGIYAITSARDNFRNIYSAIIDDCLCKNTNNLPNWRSVKGPFRLLHRLHIN